MKVATIDSKKYFRESVLMSIPVQFRDRNKKLINKTLTTLANKYVGKTNTELNEKYDIGKEAWKELTGFLIGKVNLTSEEIKYVKFLEQESIRLSAGEQTGGEEKLLDFRESSTQGIANTCCYQCGQLLERYTAKKNLHYCTKKENLGCYNKQINIFRKKQKEWKLFKFKDGAFKKPVCAKCGKLITYSLNDSEYTYNELPFCSKKHMESYRKNYNRKSKTIDSISSSRNSS